MDPNPRHRRSLTFLSPPNHQSPVTTDGDLNEDDVIFSGDFSDHRPSSASRRPLHRQDSPGILAALPQRNICRPILCRRASILPAIPKREGEEREREREYSQSAPARKFMCSAPVSVPVAAVRVLGGDLADVDVDEEGDEEILPPHEMVTRSSSMMHSNTFSVLEGVGRTLKGRDLRRVRNAVWCKTETTKDSAQQVITQKLTSLSVKKERDLSQKVVTKQAYMG